MASHKSNGSSQLQSSRQSTNGRGAPGCKSPPPLPSAQDSAPKGNAGPGRPTSTWREAMLDRLKAWSTITSQTPSEEDAGVVRGSEGEALVWQSIDKHPSYRDATIWKNRRVPSRRLGRKREIDLIVCSRKMIHLIEVKDWSGELIDGGHVWRQLHESGEIWEHPDLIADNLEKRDVVVEYLRDSGVSINGDFVRRHVCQKVVFTNPGLRLPYSISSHPDVITRNGLPDYHERQSPRKLVERILCSVIDLCLGSKASEIVQEGLYGSMSARRFNDIKAAISRLGTWDQLRLFGTKVLVGDLLKLTIGSSVYVRESLATNGAIQLRWTRGRMVGLLKALTGLGRLGKASLGRIKLPLTMDDTVKFHIVGAKSPTVCKLIDIDNILFG